MKTDRIIRIILIVLFGISLCLPFMDNVFDLDPTSTLHEFRYMSERPKFVLKWSAIASFPEEFEQYFNDRLGFRNWLIVVRRLYSRYNRYCEGRELTQLAG